MRSPCAKMAHGGVHRKPEGRKGNEVPLSEDEQRILSEIEAQLYESDPALARDIADTTLYSVAKRRLVWGAVGVVVGLALVWLLLPTSEFLALGGFVVMLFSANVAVVNARSMGRVSLDNLSQSMRGSGLRDYFGGERPVRFRDRLRRDGSTSSRDDD